MYWLFTLRLYTAPSFFWGGCYIIRIHFHGWLFLMMCHCCAQGALNHKMLPENAEVNSTSKHETSWDFLPRGWTGGQPLINPFIGINILCQFGPILKNSYIVMARWQKNTCTPCVDDEERRMLMMSSRGNFTTWPYIGSEDQWLRQRPGASWGRWWCPWMSMTPLGNHDLNNLKWEIHWEIHWEIMDVHDLNHLKSIIPSYSLSFRWMG